MNKNGSTRIKGVSLALTGAVMWGIMGIFVRNLAAFGYSEADISFIRCFCAGVVFILFKLITDPKSLKIDIKGIVICFLYGIVACAMTSVFYSICINRSQVAVATVLMFMNPMWVAIISIFMFKEKLKLQTVFIILVCFVGASLVSNILSASSSSFDVFAIAAGILSGLCFALQITIPRYISDKYNYKRDTVLAYGFIGAAISLVFFVDFGVVVSSFLCGQTSSLVINLLGIGILCTMVANVSFVKATIYIPTTTCAILSAFEVVVGVGVGYMLYSENLRALQILGAIVVVFASLGSTILEIFNSKKTPEFE